MENGLQFRGEDRGRITETVIKSRSWNRYNNSRKQGQYIEIETNLLKSSDTSKITMGEGEGLRSHGGMERIIERTYWKRELCVKKPERF